MPGYSLLDRRYSGEILRGLSLEKRITYWGKQALRRGGGKGRNEQGLRKATPRRNKSD